MKFEFSIFNCNIVTSDFSEEGNNVKSRNFNLNLNTKNRKYNFWNKERNFLPKIEDEKEKSNSPLIVNQYKKFN